MPLFTGGADTAPVDARTKIIDRISLLMMHSCKWLNPGSCAAAAAQKAVTGAERTPDFCRDDRRQHALELSP